MTDSEVEELKRIAAEMYRMLEDAEPGTCLEPTQEDDVCPPGGCPECEWYRNDLKDSLVRLGVKV